MYRERRRPLNWTCSNPWVVFCTVVAVVASAAIITVLFVHYFTYDTNSRFYRSQVVIMNVPYSEQLSSPGTQEYRMLSERIESMITTTFRKSNLRSHFARVYVIRLREKDNNVVAEFVMKFRFVKRGEAMESRIQAILQQMGNSENLEIKPPSGITTITNQDIESILTKACGARADLITLSAERVIGGSQAAESDWPWQVSLQLNGVHECGGVLISNMWLLTAAHCFKRSHDPEQWVASFGVSTRFPKERVRVRSISIHSDYSLTTHENDIAAVQLDRIITFTKDIHRVCLPEAAQSVTPGSPAYVTGWGSMAYGGNVVTNLRQGQVRIISNRECNAPSRYNGAILPRMLCAGLLSGMVDACQGDSGGPLVQEDSRRLWFLVGIVSWGYRCGVPDMPGVYTAVSGYRDWIKQETGI